MKPTNDYGYSYQGPGIYDRDTGEFLERMKNCPEEVEVGTVWEGYYQDWKETFIN